MLRLEEIKILQKHDLALVRICITTPLISKEKTFVLASFQPDLISFGLLEACHVIDLTTSYHGIIVRVHRKYDLVHSEYVFQYRILEEVPVSSIIF